ncbi:MAG: hypothetical protein F4Y01_12805 [Gammaproteobacteria bacterium]|nr:hypothetical protein [Gammaproteobacteria bacterium]
MAHETASVLDSKEAGNRQRVEPSPLTALPHFLPLAIFPLLFVAIMLGGWWLLAPFAFMSITGPLDRLLGADGRRMDPAKTSERRLFWHNLPVWTWAVLWPPTLIFGMWMILVAERYAIWEAVALAIILTMEAQAVFVVGHELVHRRSTWERRLGEFLLASASYPQYATEHVYIHHAKVGTPHDVGSARKGESFWHYFPKEVVSNLLNSWQVAGERLRRRNLPRWHLSNPFWRYGVGIAFWYGVVFWMGGIWAVPVFAFLGLGCVFSMKLSNYFQHYGLRRVRLPGGRWEKATPRHSWDADWKYSNWMFFNMQRHADHHAMASRPYPLLQAAGADESPVLPGTYADMMNIVLRPKRWFEKMDPLVDQWRKHFYPDMEDWSAYDSPVAAARPDAFEAIVEIFGAAPRLAKWIEQSPQLLDALEEREFTDLDLPQGFGPDPESEAIARRGLARLYWTREMGVCELTELAGELPAADGRETAEAVRNWANDKAFQVGVHVLRGNLSPGEARMALSNLAEASLATVAAAVVADIAGTGPGTGRGIAVVALGDLASREIHPDSAIDVLLVHDGWQASESQRLARRLGMALRDLAQHSLLFSPTDSKPVAALPLGELAGRLAEAPEGAVPLGLRARRVFDWGDAAFGGRVDEAGREALRRSANAPLPARPNRSATAEQGTRATNYANMHGGLIDTETAARLLLLNQAPPLAQPDDSPAPAAVILANCGAERLAKAATLWRDLEGIMRLVGEEGFDIAGAAPNVKSVVASACGYENYQALELAVSEAASGAVAEIDALVAA